MSFLILVLVLFLVFGGGFYGMNRGYYGSGGFGGIIGLAIVIMLLMYLFGGLGFHRGFY